ncbi:MAG: glycerophosphodiester phosphodiesterase [Bacteroidales bacterium]
MRYSRKATRWLEFICILGFCLGGQGCERMQTFPDNPLTDIQTIILGHRGGGFFDRGNTLEGCIYGFQHAGGIECDIQKSKDETLWLDHSNKLLPCGVLAEACFSETSDSRIEEYNRCLGEDARFYMLDTVLAFMKKYYPDKFISLDAKAWSPCNISELNMIREMNMLGKAIADAAKKHGLARQIMVESENGDLLYYLKVNAPEISTYLSTNGDFELGVSRALKAGFTGISFKFKYDEEITKEHVEMIHRKGLKIQVWTVDEPDDMLEALGLNPDFIQTNNLQQ